MLNKMSALTKCDNIVSSKISLVTYPKCASRTFVVIYCNVHIGLTVIEERRAAGRNALE